MASQAAVMTRIKWTPLSSLSEQAPSSKDAARCAFGAVAKKVRDVDQIIERGLVVGTSRL